MTRRRTLESEERASVCGRVCWRRLCVRTVVDGVGVCFGCLCSRMHKRVITCLDSTEHLRNYKCVCCVCVCVCVCVFVGRWTCVCVRMHGARSTLCKRVCVYACANWVTVLCVNINRRRRCSNVGST
jgi:hypothetical protein